MVGQPPYLIRRRRDSCFWAVVGSCAQRCICHWGFLIDPARRHVSIEAMRGLPALVTTCTLLISCICGGGNAERIKIPVSSSGTAQEQQQRIEAALPELQSAINTALVEEYPGFDVGSTGGTWFSASSGSVTAFGESREYAELVIRVRYTGDSPPVVAVRQLFESVARRELERRGFQTLQVNPMGFPVFPESR